MPDEQITRLLNDWGEGDEEALNELTPLVYDQLRLLAKRAFSGESAGHTLQPTALVHEAFKRLVGSDVDWQDRNHFFALTSRMMRRILVNHARTRQSARRGGDALRVTLKDFPEDSPGTSEADILSLDMALQDLHKFDERKARALELYYFGGLSYTELAHAMGLAESTVHLDLRTAKAWLNNRLSSD